MITVPQGYTLLHQKSAILALKTAYSENLLSQGIADPAHLLRNAPEQEPYHRGRCPAPALPIAGVPGERMVVRTCLRGGLMRCINRSWYLGPDRPFRELTTAAAALAQGIPTAEILAAVSIQVAGPLYRCYLISKELPSCSDLPAYLTQLAEREPASFAEQKRQLLHKVARLISLMHDGGFYHGDLNLRNILVDRSDPEQLYIIDWDKSFSVQSLALSKRRANVLRFCRSMAKCAERMIPLTEHDRLFVLESYWDDPAQAGRDARYLRRSLTIRRPWWKLFSKKHV